MKATAIAPANIAFIKYWGKTDEALRIPANSSISMNLSAATTTTTVEFSDQYKEDSVILLPFRSFTKYSHVLLFSELENGLTEQEKLRVVGFLDNIRQKAKIVYKAKVVTQNSFPKGTGIASSASGFAALALAASTAAGLSLTEKELTILARMGSGSACRSIPDGFVLWEAGDSSDTSYAYSLFSHTYWDLRDIVVVVTEEEKDISSTGGMADVETSPLWQKRQTDIPTRMAKIRDALTRKDFFLLGETIEEDCLSMHEVMQTQNPPLYYWTDMTKSIMETVRSMRASGIPVYFTIDAGPNVHCICEAKDENRVLDVLKDIDGVKRIITNKPAPGARLVEAHLF